MQQLMKPWLHKFNQWTKTIWPAFIWSAFIFVLLIIPSSKLPNETLVPIPYFDKIVHLILFGGFAFFWDQYLVQENKILQRKYRYLIILLAIILYGLLLEYLQLFVGRSFDMFDLLADIGGIIALKNPGKKSRV
jgi:VanZ family protein